MLPPVCTQCVATSKEQEETLQPESEAMDPALSPKADVIELVELE